MKYQENPQMQEDFQRKWYKKNLEVNKEYKKRGTNKILKLIKKISKAEISRKQKNCDKVDSFLQQVKQSPFYICTICHRSLYQRSVSCASMKNIIFLLQKIQWNHLMKNFIYVKHVIRILIKMKFHVKQFAIKWQ